VLPRDRLEKATVPMQTTHGDYFGFVLSYFIVLLGESERKMVEKQTKKSKKELEERQF
jgi:hypothetical protein